MLKKILYPLDLEGTSLQNRIDGELHTIGRDRYRAFAVNFGFFYANSVTVKDRGTGRLLERGNDKDYQILYFSKEITAMTMGKQEVGGVILILNPDVGTDLEVGYNLVGGHYANYSAAIEEAIRLLELDNRNVYWKDVLLRPDLFTPAPHVHDVGDVYGFEYIIDLLGYINNSILIGDNEVHNQILAAINQLRADLTKAHAGHLADKGNPHGTTAEQVNAYTKEAVDKFIQDINKKFADLEPRFKAMADAMAELARRLTANETGLGQLSDKLSQSEKNISKLVEQIGGSASENEIINGKVKAIEKEIEGLKERDKGHDTDINNIRLEINQIKQVNSTQTDKINEIIEVNNQQGQTLSSHGQTLNSHQQAINNLNLEVGKSLRTVPPATDVAYGGFKYTFANGVLNLYI